MVTKAEGGPEVLAAFSMTSSERLHLRKRDAVNPDYYAVNS